MCLGMNPDQLSTGAPREPSRCTLATTEHAVWDTPAHLLQANDARRRPIATSKAARVPAAARTWSAPLFSHVVLLPTRRIGRVRTRAALASAHTA